MSKIFKLFIDENIKTWKKFSTKLSIIVIVLALIGALGLTKVMEYIDERNTMNSIDWRENVKYDIEYYKVQLSDETLEQEYKSYYENLITVRELNLKYDINPYDSLYWKSSLLSGLTITSDETEKEEIINLIEKDDYTAYINMKKEENKKQLDEKQITQEEYNDKMLIIDLYEKCEIGKERNDNYTNQDWKNSLVLFNIPTAQESLRTGIDKTTNKVLTVEKKQQYEDEIKMDIYRLENNIRPLETTTDNYRRVFETIAPSFVVAMIAISAIIIAGGAISTEISTGTIKFWALTPNKRWKILTAKILSILFYIVVVTLVMSLISIVCGDIFFDTEGGEYLYVRDGKVKTIGSVLYAIATYFAKIIPVIVFTIFALMLSTITRNTSVAISFSVATYIGNGIAMAIINQYINKDWLRFIPFNNLNIADKIFPNAGISMSIFGNSIATTSSLQFSLAVLGICIILMLVTMYDSFNKRDII